MSRLFPHPLLSGVLVILWLLLVNSLSLGSWIMGLFLGWGIPRLCTRMWFENARPRHGWTTVRLLLRVTKDALIANIQVAALVLGPTGRLKPAFIEVPVDIRDELGLTLLMSIISLTPGTVSAELSEDHSRILVHALSEENPEQLIHSIKTRYEQPLMEIFPC
jgi:multicomponent K+:H+ antiporter subunit E